LECCTRRFGSARAAADFWFNCLKRRDRATRARSILKICATPACVHPVNARSSWRGHNNGELKADVVVALGVAPLLQMAERGYSDSQSTVPHEYA